jgi:hypothetical protein
LAANHTSCLTDGNGSIHQSFDAYHPCCLGTPSGDVGPKSTCQIANRCRCNSRRPSELPWHRTNTSPSLPDCPSRPRWRRTKINFPNCKSLQGFPLQISAADREGSRRCWPFSLPTVRVALVLDLHRPLTADRPSRLGVGSNRSLVAAPWFNNSPLLPTILAALAPQSTLPGGVEPESTFQIANRCKIFRCKSRRPVGRARDAAGHSRSESPLPAPYCRPSKPPRCQIKPVPCR